MAFNPSKTKQLQNAINNYINSSNAEIFYQEAHRLIQEGADPSTTVKKGEVPYDFLLMAGLQNKRASDLSEVIKELNLNVNQNPDIIGLLSNQPQYPQVVQALFENGFELVQEKADKKNPENKRKEPNDELHNYFYLKFKEVADNVNLNKNSPLYKGLLQRYPAPNENYELALSVQSSTDQFEQIYYQQNKLLTKMQEEVPGIDLQKLKGIRHKQQDGSVTPEEENYYQDVKAKMGDLDRAVDLLNTIDKVRPFSLFSLSNPDGKQKAQAYIDTIQEMRNNLTQLCQARDIPFEINDLTVEKLEKFDQRLRRDHPETCFTLDPAVKEQYQKFFDFEDQVRDTVLIAHKLGIEEDLTIKAHGLEKTQDLSGFKVSVTVPAVKESLDDFIAGDDYKALKQEATPDEAKSMDDVMGVVQEAFERAQKPHSDKSPTENWKETAQAYLEGKPVLYESSWKGHSAMTVLYKDRIYIANKGAGTDYMGIKSFQIGNLDSLTGGNDPHMSQRDRIDATAAKIAQMANYERVSRHLPGGIQDYMPGALGHKVQGKEGSFSKAEPMVELDLRKINVVELTGQKVGNCSYTNTKRGVDAIMMALQDRQRQEDFEKGQFPDDFPAQWKQKQTVDALALDKDKIYQAFAVHDRVREINKFCEKYLPNAEAAANNPSAVDMLMLIFRDQCNPNSSKNIESGKAILNNLHKIGISDVEIQNRVEQLPKEKTVHRLAAVGMNIMEKSRKKGTADELSTRSLDKLKEENKANISSKAKVQQRDKFYQAIGIPPQNIVNNQRDPEKMAQIEAKISREQDPRALKRQEGKAHLTHPSKQLKRENAELHLKSPAKQPPERANATRELSAGVKENRQPRKEAMQKQMKKAVALQHLSEVVEQKAPELQKESKVSQKKT